MFNLVAFRAVLKIIESEEVEVSNEEWSDARKSTVMPFHAHATCLAV